MWDAVCRKLDTSFPEPCPGGVIQNALESPVVHCDGMGEVCVPGKALRNLVPEVVPQLVTQTLYLTHSASPDSQKESGCSA